MGKPWENHGKTPWENGGLTGFYGIYPLVMTNIATENHHSEWENRLFLWPFSVAMSFYQRVSLVSPHPKWVNHSSPATFFFDLVGIDSMWLSVAGGFLHRFLSYLPSGVIKPDWEIPWNLWSFFHGKITVK